MIWLIAALTFANDDPQDVLPCDHYRFGYTAEGCREAWLVAKRRAEWARTNASVSEWIEADWRRECWDVLDNVKRIHSRDPKSQRHELIRLKTLLGAEWYYLGVMPDYVPRWDGQYNR